MTRDRIAALRGPEGIEERITAVLEGYVVSTHLRCGYRVGDRWLDDRDALDRHVQLRTEMGWVPDEASARTTSPVTRSETRFANDVC